MLIITTALTTSIILLMVITLCFERAGTPDIYQYRDIQKEGDNLARVQAWLTAHSSGTPPSPRNTHTLHSTAPHIFVFYLTLAHNLNFPFLTSSLSFYELKQRHTSFSLPDTEAFI